MNYTTSESHISSSVRSLYTMPTKGRPRNSQLEALEPKLFVSPAEAFGQKPEKIPIVRIQTVRPASKDRNFLPYYLVNDDQQEPHDGGLSDDFKAKIESRMQEFASQFEAISARDSTVLVYKRLLKSIGASCMGTKATLLQRLQRIYARIQKELQSKSLEAKLSEIYMPMCPSAADEQNALFDLDLNDFLE